MLAGGLCPCDSVNPLTDPLSHSSNTSPHTFGPGITELRAWVRISALSYQLCELGHVL